MQTETMFFCSDWVEDAVIPVEYIRSSDFTTDSTKENPNFTGLMQGNTILHMGMTRFANFWKGPIWNKHKIEHTTYWHAPPTHIRFVTVFFTCLETNGWPFKIKIIIWYVPNEWNCKYLMLLNYFWSLILIYNCWNASPCREETRLHNLSDLFP